MTPPSRGIQWKLPLAHRSGVPAPRAHLTGRFYVPPALPSIELTRNRLSWRTTMAAVTIGDVTIGYDDFGRGDPVVFVHGHPFDRSMWQPQIDAFADRHRIVAADLRGFGQSTVLPDTMPWSAFADDIAALLDHLAIERVVLCGLSMGGQIVIEVQRRSPHTIRGVAL